MSSQYTISIHVATDVDRLRNRIREYAIIHSPPYELSRMLAPYRSPSGGRLLKIVISHSTRNVHIIDAEIRHHVLRTAVTAFQHHRLGHASSSPYLMPTRILSAPERAPRPDRSTGQQCTICFEDIMESNLEVLPCAHTFHRECIGRWTRQNASCPVCRFVLA